MNNIEIARQTMKITKERAYEIGGRRVELPEMDFRAVEIFSPKAGKELLDWDISGKFGEQMCRISVVNEDSFQAAHRFENPFVMNFANAHNPGGGFLLGANAQEEALCRCSTLYASITSKAASEMYVYNNTHLSAVEFDYMLLSPKVCVFRNEVYELLEQPFEAAVVTIAAPNRYGAALLAPGKLVRETMVRRIRIMLRIAAKKGYRNLILGAWGCGAFGNKPEDVAGYFEQVLVEEEYGRCFDEVCFAIYGSPEGKNISAFRRQLL